MKVYLLLILVMFISSLACISVEELLLLEKTGDYIVGKGIATSETQADKDALDDLATQIVVNVKSSFEDVAEESNQGVNEYCKKVTKTYSNVNLTNAYKLKAAKEDGFFVVYRYISKQAKDAFFRDRLLQVSELVDEGYIAESKGNIVDAIRNYYWALMLLKTHPDYKTYSYYLGGEDKILNISLLNRIDQLLDDIEIVVISKSSKEDSNCVDYVLLASYKNVGLDGIRVKYHDGNIWSNFNKWGNGQGYITIRKDIDGTIDNLRLLIDYKFEQYNFSEDIRNTLMNLKTISFPSAEKSISLKEIQTNNQEIAEKEAPEVKFDEEISLDKKQIVSNIIDAIEKDQLNSTRDYFSINGFRELNRLLGYGHAQILPIEIQLTIMKTNELEIIRSVPMRFSFSTSNEPFVEKVNFVFNKDEKIDGITFALSDESIKDIRSKKYADEKEKDMIINFAEQYKTAYCLKDLDFIKNVFSRDALIIVGKMTRLEADPQSDKLYQQIDNSKFSYVKMGKEEYIKRLEKTFRDKEFINIRFADNVVSKVGAKDIKVFGMQIKQYYYSSNYADQGYLFLMFNLNDPDNPKIMVRSWQPRKAEDGSILGLDDFLFE